MYREKDQPRGLWVSAQLGLVHQQSGQCWEAAHRHPHGVQPPAGDPHHGAEEPPHPPAPLLRPLLSIHPHVWPSEQTAGGGPERHHYRAGQSTRRHRVVCQGQEQRYVLWTETRTCDWLYNLLFKVPPSVRNSKLFLSGPKVNVHICPKLWDWPM